MENWIVAVSGGPDSMALLHKMMTQNHRCIVAHVNYHMREESNSEADLVRDFCIAHGLVFEMRHYESLEHGNFQQLARNFRYQFFKDLVGQYDARGVIVGHHRDDDIETFLIQQERNMLSDTTGLQEYASVRDILVWRPLLGQSKTDLITYCDHFSVPYAIDKSNLDTKYTRNRIRHSDIDKEKAETLMHETRKQNLEFKKRLNQQFDFDEVTLRLNDYQAMEHTPLILREWIRFHQGDIFHYTQGFFAELDRQIRGDKAYHDFGAVELYCDHGIIALAKPQPFAYKLDTLPEVIEGVCRFAKSGTTMQGLNVSSADFPLCVRSHREGDEIEMRFGTKSVSRFFIDKKIPRYRRKNWLVIENAIGKVIFVVGMGCDVHHYSNNPETFVIE